MRVLLYHQLDPVTIPAFEKVRRALAAGDFRAAQVKKVGPNLYRARLDRSDRLLFALHQHRGEMVVLILEHIANHAYDKSRFLRRGVGIDEEKLPELEAGVVPEAEPLVYLHPDAPTFHILDKVISFDDAQRQALTTPTPLIVIGSAGSGKTALTLERLKLARGQVLYLTRSPFLVRNSREQYYALGYKNEMQEVSFLSFMEYLASWRVPEGRELRFRDFARWFAGHRVASGLRDAHQVFEEFQGVLTGVAVDRAHLSLEEYLGLGIRQSIFPPEQRENVYRLFRKYLDFLSDEGFHDANLLSHRYRDLVEPRYDFVVVDEVQDVTTVQLDVVLRSLRTPGAFVLCGDANQIVHPNFFSWAKVKSFFREVGDDLGPIRILNANYRNSEQVTELANRVLKLKTVRFGSIDRESHFLVRSNGERTGAAILLADTPAITAELNRKTRRSTRAAVIVLEEHHKAAARTRFDTPLVFTIQEAKGLEYDSIVLLNFVSGNAERFREITRDVQREDVWAPELRYARARDKSDKSLEIYKFHTNALYVAITRAVENVYLVETDPDQPIFGLLGLKVAEGPLELAEAESSLETWRQEARRLELQGKEEQAQQIRSEILHERQVPWEVLVGERLRALEAQALVAGEKRAKLLLFEYAQVVRDARLLNALANAGFKPAMQLNLDAKLLNQKYFFPYLVRKPDLMLREIEQYGVDYRNIFNQTPLMVATRLGNLEHVERLLQLGADTSLVDNAGLNAFQVALDQAYLDPTYAATKLEGLVECLAPSELVVQVEDRLLKLDRTSVEYLILNVMIASFHTVLGDRIVLAGGAYTSSDIQELVDHLPETLVPETRKRRMYLSGVLARHEMDRAGPYNRRLFVRVKHGHYAISPRLSVRVGESWYPIYTLLSLDSLSLRHGGPHDPFARHADSFAQIELPRFRALMERRAIEGPASDAEPGSRQVNEQPRLDFGA
jgi:hypothetical protein